MKNTYTIRLNQIRQNPDFLNMLKALERGFQQFGIDFYLIGAVARDVWMSGVHKKPVRRATKDIDFAIFIHDTATYDDLKEYFITVEKFKAIKENHFVLIWNDIQEIDLLPFGILKDLLGGVELDTVGMASYTMEGFKEIYEIGLPEVIIDHTYRFKFCTLEGIVLLKLIAWDDRPELRRDDIKDISDILEHLFDMFANEIYEEHFDLFENEEQDLRHLAAQVLGRKIRQITRINPALHYRIEMILMSNIQQEETSQIAKIMVEFFDNTIHENVILLKQILLGLQSL